MHPLHRNTQTFSLKLGNLDLVELGEPSRHYRDKEEILY